MIKTKSMDYMELMVHVEKYWKLQFRNFWVMWIPQYYLVLSQFFPFLSAQ